MHSVSVRDDPPRVLVSCVRTGLWSHDLSLDGRGAERDPDRPACVGAVPVREGVR